MGLEATHLDPPPETGIWISRRKNWVLLGSLAHIASFPKQKEDSNKPNFGPRATVQSESARKLVIHTVVLFIPSSSHTVPEWPWAFEDLTKKLRRGYSDRSNKNTRVWQDEVPLYRHFLLLSSENTAANYYGVEGIVKAIKGFEWSLATGKAVPKKGFLNWV